MSPSGEANKFSVHYNNIIPSNLVLQSGMFPRGIPTRIWYAFLIFPMHATYSISSPSFGHTVYT